LRKFSYSDFDTVWIAGNLPSAVNGAAIMTLLSDGLEHIPIPVSLEPDFCSKVTMVAQNNLPSNAFSSNDLRNHSTPLGDS
jgi:hypothetical protein